MCLTVGNLKIEEAQEDLTFYKIVLGREMPDGEMAFTTLYRDYHIKLGETYTEDGDFEVKYDKIHGGCFHLYERLEAPQRMCGIKNGYDTRWQCLSKSQCFFVILKAVVPKGTKFVRGTFSGDRSVVAKSVRYELFEKISKPYKVQEYVLNSKR